MTRRLEGRDGRIWRAYILGTTQEELARQEGISQQRVSQIIREVRAAIPEPELAEERTSSLEVLRTLRAELAALVDAPPAPAYSNGRPILDDQGRQVPDHGGRLAAMDRLLKVEERAGKLLGLDAAIKADVTVTEAGQRAAEAAASAAMARLYDADSEDK